MKRLIRKANSVYYHGTSTEFLNRIAQDGLKPGAGLEEGAHNGLTEDDSVIYVTPYKWLAETYANEVCANWGGEPIVLELQLDNSMLRVDSGEVEDYMRPGDWLEDDVNDGEITLNDFPDGKLDPNATYIDMEDFNVAGPRFYEWTPGEGVWKAPEMFEKCHINTAQYIGGIIPPNQITNLNSLLEKYE